MTWGEIDQLGKDYRNKPEDLQHMVGMKKSVTYEGIGTGDVEIVDICHSDYGGVHTFVFMSCVSLQTTIYGTDCKNYRNTTICWDLEHGIYWNALPEDLRNVMKSVNTKYYSSATQYWGSQTDPKTALSKYFLPSVAEIGLSTGKDFSAEGTVFQKFTSNSSRIRYNIGTETPCKWWTRSLTAYYNNKGAYIYVWTDGGFSSSYIVNAYENNAYGVVPVFCI